MKKLRNAAFMLAAVLVSVLFFYVNAEAAADVAINSTNFPDAKFRSYVETEFDTNSDGKLSAAEIKAVKSIELEEVGVKNLKGVEHFIYLTELDCFSNSLKSIDVSKLTKLTYLSVESNELTKLDVSKNTALKYLWCSYNKLTALNVSSNTKLILLSCGNNKLTALDVSKNSGLKTLWCENNLLTKLDLSKLPNIYRVDCCGNKIGTLNIGVNKKLNLAYHWADEKTKEGGHTRYTYYDYEAPLSEYDDPDEDIGDMGLDYGLCVDNTTKILSAPKITSPTKYMEKTVKSGKKVSLKVTAQGTGLKYQWFYKKAGSSKLIKVSAKAGRKATYTFKVKARHNGYVYICKVTNANGTTESAEIKLNVAVKPKITSPKKATTKTLAVGKLASFKIKATGASAYQWEYRTSKSAPWQPVTLASGKTANYKLTVQARHNGYQYRCKVTNVGGQYVYSKIFTLKVKS
jgi:hemin uptake protein HemP